MWWWQKILETIQVGDEMFTPGRGMEGNRRRSFWVKENTEPKRNLMNYKITIIIEKDNHGYYAFAPDLQGCQSQGDSLEEILANIRESIELYLETLSEEEIKTSLSKEILTTSMEIRVG